MDPEESGLNEARGGDVSVTLHNVHSSSHTTFLRKHSSISGFAQIVWFSTAGYILLHCRILLHNHLCKCGKVHLSIYLFI